MQHVIAQTLESDSAEPVAACLTQGPGVCEVLEFVNPEQEAAYLADLIHREVAAGQNSPRDYCVLVRQRVGAMVELLQQELGKRGVVLRDESALQDLRTEPLTELVLSTLRLATRTRDAEAWGSLTEQLGTLSGLDPERDAILVERLAVEHKECAKSHLASQAELVDLPLCLIKLLGQDRYRSTYRQYVSKEYLETVAGNLGTALQDSLTAVDGDARLVTDHIAGVNVLPAMTIHKSKGLEFTTVIFLGLEDAQWWGFRTQPEEEKRAFFVAFSRAIRRVLFTWSDERDGRSGRELQARQSVDTLHGVLAQATVPTVDLRRHIPTPYADTSNSP